MKQSVHLPMKLCDQEGIWKTQLHIFTLTQNNSLHELTPITDAYQWNAHDHLEYTILAEKFSMRMPMMKLRNDKYIMMQYTNWINSTPSHE